MIGTPFEI
jgi:hypothetical protein